MNLPCNIGMNNYKQHGYLKEIIIYFVCLYYRFNFSHLDTKDILFNSISETASYLLSNQYKLIKNSLKMNIYHHIDSL